MNGRLGCSRITGIHFVLIVGDRRVPRAGVAALAQERRSSIEHFLIVRAVRIVAVHAVLADRRMLPQERAALVGMAGVAGVVGRIGLEHLGRGAAMRVVAGIAGHFAFQNRHVRVAAHFRHDILMALSADLLDPRLL